MLGRARQRTYGLLGTIIVYLGIEFILCGWKIDSWAKGVVTVVVNDLVTYDAHSDVHGFPQTLSGLRLLQQLLRKLRRLRGIIQT